MSLQFNRLLWFFGGFVAAAVSWMGVLAFIRDKPVPNAIFSQSIIDYKLEAVALAEKSEASKTFLVGGSSVAYGIDSEKIERALGTEVVNFGCIAGIGPEIILSSIKERLSSGDRILFSWEYGLYLFERKHQDITYLNLIFGSQNKLLRTYSITDRLYLSMALPVAHFRQSFVHYLNPFVDSEIYKCGWKFDSSGNIRSNLGSVITKKELNKAPLGALLTKMTISVDVREIMTEFLEYCRSHGVLALATWPSIYGHEKYSSPIVTQNIGLIYDFWTSLDVPVVGKAEDAMMRAEFFYDTFYHPNEKGLEFRTEKLIEELRPWFAECNSSK